MIENEEGQLIGSSDKDSTKKILVVLVVLVILVILLAGALSFVIVRTGFLSQYLPDTSSSECSIQIQRIEEILETSSEISNETKNIIYTILATAKNHDREGRDSACSNVVVRALDRLSSL